MSYLELDLNITEEQEALKAQRAAVPAAEGVTPHGGQDAEKDTSTRDREGAQAPKDTTPRENGEKAPARDPDGT